MDHACSRSIQLKDWEVNHHMGKHGTRYAIKWHEEKFLMEEVAKCKERLVAWFAFAHAHAKIPHACG